MISTQRGYLSDTMKECKIEGCSGKHYAKGYCSRHYNQQLIGNPITDRTSYDKNEIIIHDEYAEIVLYNQKNIIIARAKIDLEDIDKVKNIKWHCRNDFYVLSSKRKRLHRFLLDATKENDVDHINNNKLDNRKSNLRICTRSQNLMNRKAKGYSFFKSTKKWEAYITKYYKRTRIGYFETKEEAIKARREAEIKYFGEYRHKGELYE